MKKTLTIAAILAALTVGAAAQDKPSTQNMAKQTKAAISAYQKADSLKDRDKAIAHLKKSINIYERI